jgi:hypothetical protein
MLMNKFKFLIACVWGGGYIEKRDICAIHRKGVCNYREEGWIIERNGDVS